jgi:hypothetical protein
MGSLKGLVMETDAELTLWGQTFRNWSLTAKFIPLPVLRRRLLAAWPHLDADAVLRNIQGRMDGLLDHHRRQQQFRSSWH